MRHPEIMNSNGVSKMLFAVFVIITVKIMSTMHATEYFPLCLSLAVAVLLAVIIILITGALAVGVFLNYKRTGSFIPSMPKLPRYLLAFIHSVSFTSIHCLCNDAHSQ